MGKILEAGDWVSLGAAVVAVVALIFTWAQAKSAREQAHSAKEQVALGRRQTEVQENLYRDQQQPYVWLDFRLDPVSYWLVDLVMKNEGPTVATNVRLEIDPPIKRSQKLQKWTLEDLPGFKDGFASFPPGRELRWSLGAHTDIFDERTFTKHTITVHCDGPFGPVEPLTYVLDYADGRFMAIRDEGNLKAISDALNKGENSLLSAIKNLKP
ncbi:hypothetical protein AQ436_01830 [Arthrobacter sp. EpRS66]|nr:hypothetical protein AQ436_01830 [Arthrobacter sp. EpRS66]